MSKKIILRLTLSHKGTEWDCISLFGFISYNLHDFPKSYHHVDFFLLFLLHDVTISEFQTNGLVFHFVSLCSESLTSFLYFPRLSNL